MSRYDEDLTAPRTLTDHEVKALLRVSGERRAGFRDHVILGLALSTALREHEVAGLNVGDVFDQGGRARIRVALRVFKRSNQNAAEQQILLSDAWRAKLEKFRAWKKSHGESLDDGAPLFVSRKGTESRRASSGGSFTSGRSARARTCRSTFTRYAIPRARPTTD